MSSQSIVHAELKSLLILLLLKEGTSAEQIRTAMQIAATSLLMEEGQHERKPVFERENRPKVCPYADAKIQPLTSKQIIRNGYLAPIKGYAA